MTNGVFQSRHLASNSWIPNWTDYLGQLQTSGARMPTGSTSRAAEQHQKTTDYAFTAEFDATERLSFSGDVQYVDATADNYDYTLNTQVNPSALAVDLTGSLPSVSAGPDGYLDQRDNFFWAAGMDDTQQNDATQFAARLQHGVRHRFGMVPDASRRACATPTARPPTAIRATTGSPSASGGRAMRRATGPVTSRAWTATSPAIRSSSTSRTSSAANANLPGSLWVASDSLVRNLNNNGSLIQTAWVNGSGWAPDSFQDGDTNVQQEKTYAAFGLLRFGHELGSTTLDGNVGVRVVRTDYSASGSAKQPDWTQHPLLNNNGDPDFVAK